MIARALVALTRFIVGGHPSWHGAEPAVRSRVYFANHASHLDTLLIWAALPADVRRRTHPVAGADYWGRTPLRRRIAQRGFNAILVDRSGERDDGKDPLDPLRTALRQAQSLILFPEGTRSQERLPAPFKSGLYWLAHEFPDVELVPVYLENPARAFPKGALLPVPITCRVHFGLPIALATGEARADFLRRARSAIVALAPAPLGTQGTGGLVRAESVPESQSRTPKEQPR